MKTFEGKLVSQNIKIGIVAARFNEFITSKLLSGAMDGLLRHDVQDADVHVAWVPGAFEIPLVASKMAKSGKYDAVICLGAVIRGSTSHYDYVCNEVSIGVLLYTTLYAAVMLGIVANQSEKEQFLQIVTSLTLTLKRK